MKKILLSLLLFLFFCFRLQAGDAPVWLSNVPPAGVKKYVSHYGMHRLCTQNRDRRARGPVHVIQWIRRGASVEHARYLSVEDTAAVHTYVFSPQKKEIRSQIIAIRGKSVVAYSGSQEGYYNVYLIMKHVSGDTLYVDIAKAELLSHSCRNGHKNVRRAILPKIYPEKVPFEIVRKRHVNENFHFFAASGDRFTYQSLFQGKPVARVPMVMCTEKGWTKSVSTNHLGEVQFQFIQDYFTHWSELNGRKIYYYLVYSVFTKERPGEYRGQHYRYVHYTTSLSDGYFPAKTMYMSLVWGLVVFIGATVLIAAGIFIFRERRKKPFKEYVFDENE